MTIRVENVATLLHTNLTEYFLLIYITVKRKKNVVKHYRAFNKTIPDYDTLRTSLRPNQM